MRKEIHKIPSSKLQRMRLKLLNYDIQLEHAPGKTIVLADYLSRYMNMNEEAKEDKTFTESVLSINVSNEKKNELKNETERDENLREIKKYCMNGWPNDKLNCPEKLRFYYRLKNDIVLEDGILFFNERVMIPNKMREQIIEKLHEPHFGITKTLNIARQAVYW